MRALTRSALGRGAPSIAPLPIRTHSALSSRTINPQVSCRPYSAFQSPNALSSFQSSSSQPPHRSVSLNLNPQQETDYLKQYCVDLTQLARDGKLDPIIGRDEETRRCIEILSRRTKNNPIVVGAAGVGKTAIIEGLSQRIVDGDVPESLRGKRLLSLDLAALVAGAKFHGEFEERLKGLIRDVEKNPDVLLFCDEIHMLAGAGQAHGMLPAAQMLKPALARGTLHLIGATTLGEYRKYIESDPALARRFQSVYVAEPTIADTISILRGIKERFELHHGVPIRDSAVVQAAMMAKRYITERMLPDSAVDLVDEAAAKLRMQQDSKPDVIADLEHSILTDMIEMEALKKEHSAASKQRLSKLQGRLEHQQKLVLKLNQVWQSEQQRRQKLKDIRKQIDDIRVQIAERVRFV